MQQQLGDSLTSSEHQENQNQNQEQWEDIDSTQKKSINPNVLAIWEKLEKQPHKVKSFSFKFPPKKTQKTVCAKTITKNQTIVECYDCRTDPTCIICLDCFKNSNHEGHKYVIKTAYGGCCDCGDSEAWKQQGFCSKHSGKCEDVQIPPKQINAFLSIFGDAFTLYFDKFLTAKKQKISLNTSDIFLNLIFKDLLKLNTDSAYYNKLTTLVFVKTIKKEDYPLNKGYNNFPILANLLRFQKKQISQQLLNLCYAMFPYYPFKQTLLSYYFNYYSFIYNGSGDSNGAGSSYSCQLISSFQLVGDYCQGPNAVQLGYNININKLNLNKVDNMNIIILHDLEYIRKLQGQTPLKYWKMNISRGIDNLFCSYEKIIKELNKMLENNTNLAEAFTNNIFINSFQIEARLVQTITETLIIIKQDQSTLLAFLKQLYLKVAKQNQRVGLVIFKPYERIFSLVLFTYFDLNLNNIKADSIKVLAQKFGSQITQDHIKKHLFIMLKRLVNTYLFYTKIYSHPGLSSTFYPFIYFYQKKNKLLFSLDIMSIKLITLFLNTSPVFKFSEFLGINEENENSKANLSLFIMLLNSLNKLYASSAYESYVASSIDETCQFYTKQFEQIFVKAMKEKKYEVFKNQINEIQNLYHPSKKSEFTQNLVKKFCNFAKESKKFVLKPQYKSQNNIGINFADFKTSLVNNETFQPPQKTSSIIYGYNRKIAQLVWSQESIKKIVLIFHHFHQKFIQQSQQQVEKISIELYKYAVNTFAHQYLILTNLKLEKYPFPNLIKENILDLQQVRSNLDKNYHQYFGMKKQGEISITQQQRKQKLKSIREAKMLELKNKQKKIFQKMVSQEQQEIQDEKNEDVRCCVCKQDNKDNLVYLIDLKVTNHDKLLGINSKGTGVQCLSFKSCYHIFDHQCIKKITKQKNHCPLCRQHCNAIIPYQGKHSQAKQFLKKIEVIMFSLKNYEQIDVVQQVLKSFYHLVLLGTIDLQYTLKKRVPIYIHLLDFIKQSCGSKQLQKILQKTLSNEITLIPKIQKQKPKVQKQNPLTAFFQAFTAGNAVNIQIDQLDVEELVQGLNSFDEDQDHQQQGQVGVMSDEEGMPQTKKKEKKLKKIKQLQQKQQKPQKIEVQEDKTNMLLRATIQAIISELLQKPQLALMQKIQNEHHKVILQIILKALRNKQHHQHFTKQISQYDKIYFKFRQMPLKYSPLAKYQTCHECKQISASLHLCLICEEWVGCYKCHKSQKNIVIHNSKHHGQVGVFINLRTTEITILAGNIATEFGKLYKDQFCQPFDIKKSWENYHLDEAFLQEIKFKLVHDDFEVKKKSKLI